jgi:hypothetical protein
MKRKLLMFVPGALCLLLFPNRAAALYDQMLPLAAYANLRHDTFGNSYTNIYGTADLYANLNSVNDDRAVLEFSLQQLPVGSSINSATLTIYVWAGGGTTGDVGTFRLYGYTGDGAASMADYYDQQALLKTFTEGVPPTFGYTSFDVTSFIQNQNSSGSFYGGFLFQAVSQNVLMGFGCPGPNSYPWPTLDVQYTVVPEPAGPVLFLAAAAVFRLLRRFR